MALLELLRLLTILILCVAVRGKDVKCSQVLYSQYCYDYEANIFDKNCWLCEIKGDEVSKDDFLTVSGKLSNGSSVNVEIARLKGGSINEMPKLLLHSSHKEVVQLLLWSTNTKQLNSQFFEKFGGSLRYFGSYENYALSVEALAFRHCISLQYLDLGANNLSSIPFDAFFGLHKLIRLDLGFNNLKRMHSQWFQDLTNLEELYLSNNQVEGIPDDAFHKLANLKELYLGGNKIKTITRKMFRHTKNLRTIFLYDNHIKTIEMGSFKDLNRLTSLVLRKNNCTDIQFSNKTSEEIDADLTACHPTTCVIPTIKNGFVISAQDNSTQTPGASFETTSSVEVVCDPNYSLDHDKAHKTGNLCLEFEWQNEEWPECHVNLKKTRNN